MGVKLWDLRKLKNFKTIQLDEGYEVRDLSFDHTGTYLAVAGTDVRVYLCKQWTDLKVFQDHTAAATGVRFGRTPRTSPQPPWTGPSSFMDSKLSSRQNKPPTPNCNFIYHTRWIPSFLAECRCRKVCK